MVQVLIKLKTFVYLLPPNNNNFTINALNRWHNLSAGLPYFLFNILTVITLLYITLLPL